MWRRSHAAILIASILASGATAAEAQVVVVGNAQGCFGIGCTARENTTVTANGVPVSYNSGVPIDFSGTTSGGSLGINGSVGNFGTISIGSVWPPRVVLLPFYLTLSFVNPLASSTVFNALLAGYVSFDGTGGAVVGFYPSTSPGLTFVDPISGLSGTMTVTAFPTAMTSGGSSNLTGLIRVTSLTTVVPEPASLLLIGTGLFGIGAAGRRRRRS